MNDNETVREVCEEIGDWDAEVCKDHPIARPNEVLGQTMAKIRWWRDRILSAHDREMAAKDAAHKQWRENYHSQIAEKDAEIALLKAALKPVIEHDTLQYGHQRQQPSIVVAVREAQRMMREGGEK